MQIAEITDPERKSAACAAIIRTLPEWFGIPASNEHYVREVATKEVFVASVDSQPIGLIALRYHFQTTAEIWWIGIMPKYHRQGIGRRLFEAGKRRAMQIGCTSIVVMTLSPRSSDEFYARTRAFYDDQGFRLLIEFNEDDPTNPMALMSLSLANR